MDKERIAELEAALAAKDAEIEQLRREVSRACENNHHRNVSLDALHYVWCDGGCAGGVHRFGEHPPPTEEIVRSAINNTRRLVRWFENAEHKQLSNAEVKARWERQQEMEYRAEAAEASLARAKEQIAYACSDAEVAGYCGEDLESAAQCFVQKIKELREHIRDVGKAVGRYPQDDGADLGDDVRASLAEQKARVAELTDEIAQHDLWREEAYRQIAEQKARVKSLEEHGSNQRAHNQKTEATARQFESLFFEMQKQRDSLRAELAAEKQARAEETRRLSWVIGRGSGWFVKLYELHDGCHVFTREEIDAAISSGRDPR